MRKDRNYFLPSCLIAALDIPWLPFQLECQSLSSHSVEILRDFQLISIFLEDLLYNVSKL